MDQEVAAQQAAQRWRASKDARDDLRVIILELLKTKNMTEISRITGIKRTTLYYFIWGRSGKQAA